MHWLPTLICPSSIHLPSIVCYLFCGHILKTKQDRPIVTVEHYIEVGTADSVATFRFFLDPPEEGQPPLSQLIVG